MGSKDLLVLDVLNVNLMYKFKIEILIIKICKWEWIQQNYQLFGPSYLA